MVESVAYLLFFIYKSCFQGILYGAVGFACGIIGQGIANLIMTAKRYTSYMDVSFVLCTC